MDQSELIGIIQRQPTNPNFLHTHRFRFIMSRCPNVTYFLQEINLPGISMGTATQGTPFVDIPIHGDKVQFEELSISFIVDEDMKNYLEIWNWIIKLGFPQNFQQHASIRNFPGPGVDTDGMLVILNSNYNARHYWMFRGMFPISLSALSFRSTDTESSVQTATATFKYIHYEWMDMAHIGG